MTTAWLRRSGTPSAHGEAPGSREPASLGDVLAPILALGLLFALAWRISAAVSGAGDIVVACAAALLGVVATDLTSGIVHWICDTFFDQNTPVIGRGLIEPFRRHHIDPTEIVSTSVLRVNRTNLLAIAAVLALLELVRATIPSSHPSLLGNAWLLGYSIAVVLTNQIHRWAHAAHVPRPVRWMQVHGILLNPTEHGRHHANAHDFAFCITTGWLNPIFDRVVPRAASRR
jgi:ubiquitin-conjugating enzyme E2 variant